MQKTNHGQATLRTVSVVKAAEGCCRSVVFRLEFASESPEGLLKQIAETHPQSFRFTKSRWGLRTCMSNTFYGDPAAAGLQTTF